MANNSAPYIKGFAVVFLLFGVIVLYSFELIHFSNTFRVKRLLLVALVLGLFTGTLAAVHYQKQFKEQMEKVVISVICVLVAVGVFPLLISLSNRLLTIKEPRREVVELFKEEPFGESRFGIIKGQPIKADGYYIFFIRDGQLERIKSKVPRFTGVEEGSIVELPIKKGLWGFEYVEFY